MQPMFVRGVPHDIWCLSLSPCPPPPARTSEWHTQNALDRDTRGRGMGGQTRSEHGHFPLTNLMPRWRGSTSPCTHVNPLAPCRATMALPVPRIPFLVRGSRLQGTAKHVSALPQAQRKGQMCQRSLCILHTKLTAGSHSPQSALVSTFICLFGVALCLCFCLTRSGLRICSTQFPLPTSNVPSSPPPLIPRHPQPLKTDDSPRPPRLRRRHILLIGWHSLWWLQSRRTHRSHTGGRGRAP